MYSLLGVGLFILLIALVNYINLSTARSIDRAREIGVRKAVGSGKSEIVRQFLVEALVVNLLAVLVALTIVQFTVRVFFGICRNKYVAHSFRKVGVLGG